MAKAGAGARKVRVAGHLRRRPLACHHHAMLLPSRSFPPFSIHSLSVARGIESCGATEGEEKELPTTGAMREKGERWQPMAAYADVLDVV